MLVLMNNIRVKYYMLSFVSLAEISLSLEKTVYFVTGYKYMIVVVWFIPCYAAEIIGAELIAFF